MNQKAKSEDPVSGVQETTIARPQTSARAGVVLCAPKTARDPSTALGITEKSDPREWPRRRIDDFRELAIGAVDAVVIALIDGDEGGKQGPGSWLSETIENQLRHIENHIVNYELVPGTRRSAAEPSKLAERERSELTSLRGGNQGGVCEVRSGAEGKANPSEDHLAASCAGQ